MVKKCKFIEGLINCVLIEKQKVLRNGANTHHEYNNDYLNSDKIANIYFTSDVDARNRVRDLNEYNKINLNEMRRKNMPDDGDGAFKIS